MKKRWNVTTPDGDTIVEAELCLVSNGSLVFMDKENPQDPTSKHMTTLAFATGTWNHVDLIDRGQETAENELEDNRYFTPDEIKEMRQKLGMTPGEFAKAVGARMNTVVRWENESVSQQWRYRRRLAKLKQKML